MTTSPKTDDELRPPQAPEIDRRIVLRPAHATGALLLLLIVTLALTGLFDHESAELRQTVGDAEIVITYPTRLRVKNHGVIEVRLQGAPMDSLRIAIDDAYLRSFDSYAYADYLPSIAPRPAVWRFEYSASRIGRASGRLEVAVGNDAASFDIHTTILP